ncbi:MAG: desulfoferrodoxin family protein [Traorella sp.]
MKDVKFFRCNHCGNIVEKVIDAGVPVVCCGEPMKELVPNTSDGANEKHVPVVHVDGKDVVVRIGEVDHPMVPAHYIQWIYVLTNLGGMRKDLTSDMAPTASFRLSDNEEVIAVYEYCNLHGLWKVEL